MVSFAISGPGKIAAVDNGDNAGHEPFHATERHAFDGECVAFIRATAAEGEIKVTASAAGLTSGSIVIRAARFKFSFEGGPVEPGWIQVSPTNTYSAGTGFGFEPGANLGGIGCVTSDKPFLFSAALPEGNYAVTVWLGAQLGDSVTTVKAEQRRLMLERVQPRDAAPRTFIVNVRTPRISDSEMVRLKSREVETETLEWDDKLTLEFNGLHPTLRALAISPVDVPTVFIAGDSTVCDQPAEPWNSWGQMLPRFFEPEVAVANYAESGETIAQLPRRAPLRQDLQLDEARGLAPPPIRS